MKKTSLLLITALSVPTATFASGFSGPYIGAGLGYVSGKDSGIEVVSGVPDGYSQETKPHGAAYGIFSGYNWMVAPKFLLGVEAGYELRSASDSDVQVLSAVPDPTYPVKTDVKAAYSLRANIGYVLAGGRTLVYAISGYAVADIKRTFTDLSTPASQSETQSQGGWTVGMGVEQHLGNHLSMKFEYRYADYGKRTVDTTVVYGAGYLQSQEYSEHSLRVSAAYHF